MKVNLIMFTEQGKRKSFPVLESGLVVGRQDDCSLRIPIAQVSRRHAQIGIRGTDVVIRDLGSANGTYVNNKRVAEFKLSPGDKVIIGPVVFTVQIDGEPADIRAVRTKLERRPSVEATPAAETVSQQDKEIFEEDSDPISALEALTSEDSRAGLSESFFMDEEQ